MRPPPGFSTATGRKADISAAGAADSVGGVESTGGGESGGDGESTGGAESTGGGAGDGSTVRIVGAIRMQLPQGSRMVPGGHDAPQPRRHQPRRGRRTAAPRHGNARPRS